MSVDVLPPGIEWIGTAALNDRQTIEAAELAYLAFEGFYRLFSPDRDKLLTHIGFQLHDFSELDCSVIALEAGVVVGLGSYYRLDEMTHRQMAGARILLAAADDLVVSAKSLRAFARGFPEPTAGGGYVSRLAVGSGKLGSGLAAEIHMRLEENVRAMGETRMQLHVRKDNGRALAFYAKQGYSQAAAFELGYCLLEKQFVSMDV